MWVRPRSRSSAIPSRNSGVAVWSAWFRKPAFSQEALRDGPGFPPPAPAAQPPQVLVADPVGGQGGRQRIGVEPRVGARAGHRPDIRLTGTGSAPSALPAGAATRRSAAHHLAARFNRQAEYGWPSATGGAMVGGRRTAPRRCASLRNALLRIAALRAATHRNGLGGNPRAVPGPGSSGRRGWRAHLAGTTQSAEWFNLLTALSEGVAPLIFRR